jgi:hypothetical protein
MQATTLTITDCPCTIVKPVVTSSVVYCNTWYPSTVSQHSLHTALANMNTVPQPAPQCTLTPPLPLSPRALLAPPPPRSLPPPPQLLSSPTVPPRLWPSPVPPLPVSSVSLLTSCKRLDGVAAGVVEVMIPLSGLVLQSFSRSPLLHEHTKSLPFGTS